MPQNNNLRIISGKFRGRNLQSPHLGTTHPMGAREKLALFNIVAVDSLKVLDAYAGSGALGIEALSRGAEEVIFVESNSKACRIIRDNLANLLGSKHDLANTNAEDSLPDLAQIFPAKIATFAQNPEFQNHFEVIFADPPYDQIQPADLELLVKLLAGGGTLALSSPAETEPLELPGLRLSSTHTYARARITIYRKAK